MSNIEVPRPWYVVTRSKDGVNAYVLTGTSPAAAWETVKHRHPDEEYVNGF